MKPRAAKPEIDTAAWREEKAQLTARAAAGDEEARQESIRRRMEEILDPLRARIDLVRWTIVYVIPPIAVAALATLILPVGFWTALIVAAVANEFRALAPALARRIRVSRP